MVPCSHFQWFPHSSVSVARPFVAQRCLDPGIRRWFSNVRFMPLETSTGPNRLLIWIFSCTNWGFGLGKLYSLWPHWNPGWEKLSFTETGIMVGNMGLISVKYYNLPHPDLWTDVTKYWAIFGKMWRPEPPKMWKFTKKDQRIYGSIATPCNPHETHTEHQEWGLETDFPQKERFLCSMWEFWGVFHQETIGT